MTKHVYLFKEAKEIPTKEEKKNILGGKGAGLAEMTEMGIPVPPGFTITTEVCIKFLEENAYPAGLMDDIKKAVEFVEKQVGKKFGDASDPLLFSVRSGARASMPGMMDTVLNLGLNNETVEGIAKLSKNPRFAYDSLRRFIQMFGNVVKGIEMNKFLDEFDALKEKKGAKLDVDLTADDLKELVEIYKAIYKKEINEDFPQDVWGQLDASVKAVFSSWNNARAIAYREHEGFSHDWGTAVNVQTMAYGNMGDDCGTGVCFTRNPATGTDEFYGEFLINAQGEDVVAGIRTPLKISELKNKWPEVYDELYNTGKVLEKHYKDMCDIEFTIQNKKLYLLQTRVGKRTGVSAGKIAHDLVKEGLIDKKTAIMRLAPRDVENSLFPRIPWVNEKKFFYAAESGHQEIASKIGTGLPAGPGAATGHVYFTADEAEKAFKEKKIPILLVSDETTPEDFHGMVASQGILTLKGGMTSHAALVARQIGKVCIVGAETSGLKITTKKGKKVLVSSIDSSLEVYEDDFITLDGFSGKIFKDRLPILIPTDLPEEMKEILNWSDDIAKIKVRANADSPKDTQTAIDFGSTGTGLARTEHQFFEKERLPIMQKMILSDTTEDRVKYLSKLLDFQRDDFIGLYRTSQHRPVTIRLIDPPLHEFLPDEIELREKIWKENLNENSAEFKMLEKVVSLHEANPMLGLRGCRLGILYPEITEMQTRAIIEAAVEVQKETGAKIRPEIMVPLIGSANEFKVVKKVIDKVAKEVMKNSNVELKYKVGTMIEIPRAALTADEIAKAGAEFFSFGTNDLHQMTFGFSRDDIGKFLPYYLESGILSDDPFVTIDQAGTGKLMKMCVEDGRKVNPKLKYGICGEQGGEPKSIEFCYKLGLDYVSCSPFRVPVARLAAAQSTIKYEK